MLKYFPFFKGINGNNAAGVIGRNKWQSPRVYYMQFEGKLKYEFSPDAQRTVNMKNSIVERFEKDKNKHVYVNEIPFYTHPKYKYIKAYVD